MHRHFEREVQKLKHDLFTLCALVEEAFQQAVEAVLKRDAALARKVIEGDIAVDQMEVDVEEECLKILALHQPVAIDLRFIVAVLKINNDLERIGDLAVNIAERAAFLAKCDVVDTPFDLSAMARKSQSMLKRSLDALVNMDTVLARAVRAEDDEVDACNREMYDRVKEDARKHPDQLDSLIHLLCVSRHIERMADLTTNIAEDVIYMVQGEIVRHTPEDFSS